MRILFFKRFLRQHIYLSAGDISVPRKLASWLAALLLIPSGVHAQSSLIQGAKTTDFAVSAQGANHRIWQRVVPSFTNNQGRVIYRTNSYTELATGLNHLVNGKWVPSSEDIQITAGGGVATNGQHQVGFAANINESNAVEIITPNGERLKTHIMGLSYYDSATGSNVLFAELKDSIGQVEANNQVVYANAFTDCNADVRYTYTRAGFEQDIVVQQQLPAPDSYGLNPETTWLQVWTEFTDPPTPAIERILDGADERLDFGVMKMGRGKAFIMGNESNSVPVSKSWRTVQGRTFLVEQVQFDDVATQLQSLPAPSGGGGGTNGAGVQRIRYQNFPEKLPPTPKLVKRADETLKLVGARGPEKGLVLDYAFENGNITNFTFRGDTTYYITGNVNLYSNTTIEGGTVIKFTNGPSSPSLNIFGPVNCETGPYHMAVFTSKDDDNVGEQLYGSTGVPGTCALYDLNNGFSGGPNTFSYLRLCYAYFAYNDGSGSTNLLKHCQFVNNGIAVEDFGATLSLQNLLICNSSGDAIYGINSAITGVNLTVDHAGTLFVNAFGSTLNLTNCLLTAITSVGTSYGGIFNFTNNSGGVYQTAGAGTHYLAAGSPYRDAGTASIGPNLLSDLQNLTTYPPLWLTNTISADTTLYPQAQRDYDAPDVGYHYPPLDYLSACTVSNATLTLTNAVALAYFNTAGISLQSGGQLVSQGTATQRNYLAYYNLIQEQSTNISGSANAVQMSEALTWIPTTFAGAPSAFLRFTTVCAPEGAIQMAGGSDGFSKLITFTVRDCEFNMANASLEVNFASNLVSFYNNLFRYPEIDVEPGCLTLIYNNLFIGSYTNNEFADFLNSGTAPITNRDNVWDGVEVFLDGDCGHNAYLNGCHLDITPNTNDIVTNLSWQTGPLGYFYQATNSRLINAGSETAAAAGLYHYTVTTNEVPESNAMVTIGYHYVALGTNGLPLDSNGDGIPDYLEDANGNGLVDGGETAWEAPPTVTLTNPTNAALFRAGTNISLAATASASAGSISITQVQFFQGTNSLGTVTTFPYNLTWSSAAAGTYSLTARATDSGGLVTTSAPVIITVDSPPTVSLTNPTNGSLFIAPVNVSLNASATDSDGTVSQVQFFQGTNNLGTVTNSPFNLTWTNAPVGLYALTAVATDNNGLTTTSAVVNIIVDSPPTILITNPTNTAALTAPTNLTLSATASDPVGTVTQVQFFAGIKLLGTTTNGPSTFSVVWTNAPPGTYALTAVATDNYGLSTTSSVVNFTISTNLLPTADAHVRDGSFTNTNFGTNSVMEMLTTSTNGNNRDTYFKFDLTTVSNISGAKLSIFSTLNSTNAVAASVYAVSNTGWGETTITWSNKPALGISLVTNNISGTNGVWYLFDVTGYVQSQKAGGTNVISLALHNPTNVTSLSSINSKENTTNKPSLVITTTNAAPSVTITNPANHAVFPVGANVPIGASASDDGSVLQVQFFQGSNSLGTVFSPPYTTTWNNVSAGTYTLTAQAADNYGLVSTSLVVNITVEIPPTVTLTNPVGGAVFRAGANIALAASASDSDGTVSQVQFFQGSTSLGTVTNSPYSITWSNVPAANYALTARATDNNGLVTTSAVVNIIVDTPPTVSPTSPTNNATFTAPTNLTLSATASDSDGTVSQVQFFAGIKLLGTSTNVTSPYSMIWTNAPPGTYFLNAVATDNNGLSTTSTVVNITISTNLQPTADAHVRDGTFTNTNFGTNTVMEMMTTSTNGNNRDTYLKFDLSSVSNISSAKLSIFAKLSATNTVAATVYSVTNTSWGETTITWSNKPARVTALVTNNVSGTNGVWYLFDVSGYVKSQKAGGTNVISLALHNPTNVSFLLSINSKENSSNHPSLVITTTNAAPSVTITNPVNNAIFSTLSNITISATASDSDGSIVQVQFLENGTNVGIASTPPYNATWSSALPGTYALTALAMDNYGLVSTSSVVNITVIPLPGAGSLKVWLKADSITGVANNAGITNWIDSSGNTNTANQGNSSNRPLYETNVINGLPTVRFNGSNSYFNLPNFMTNFTQDEMFVVLRTATNFPTTQYNAWRFGAGINSHGLYPSTGTQGSIFDDFGSSSGGNTLGFTAKLAYQFNLSITQFNLYDVYGTQGTWAGMLNGLVLGQVSGNTFGISTAPRLGASSSSFGGDMAEVVIYNRILSGAERTAVGNYLAGKYAFLSPPTAPAPTAAPVSSSQINVFWPPNPQGAQTVYLLERKPSGGSYQQIATLTNSGSYVDAGLAANTQYTYRLRTQTYAGTSGYSSEVTATTYGSGSSIPVNQIDLWYAADSLSGLTNGASVVVWNDRSGQGRDAVEDFNWQHVPVFITNAINGRPVVRWLTTNAAFLDLPNFVSNAPAAEMFVVLKTAQAVPSQPYGPWRMGGSISTGNVNNYYPGTDGSIAEDFGSTLIHYIGVPAQPLNQYHFFNAQGGPNLWVARINGVTIYSTTNNTFGFCGQPGTGFTRQLGIAIDATFAGDIAEFLSFNTALTQDQRDAVQYYLNQKYAFVTNQPVVPANFQAEAVSVSQIVLHWNPSPGGVPTSYTIQRKIGTNGTYADLAVQITNTSYTDTGLTAGTLYCYHIKSHNLNGDSSYGADLPVQTLQRFDGFPLANMKLWLRPNAIVGLTSGSGVADWPDWSGLTNDASQPNPANQPLFYSNVLNGAPVVRFNATNQVLNLSNVLSGLNQAELFVVLRAATNVAPAPLQPWKFGSSPNAGRYPDVDGTIMDDFGSTSSQISTPSSSITAAHIFNVVAINGGEWTSRLNGVQLYSIFNNSFGHTSMPVLGALTNAFAGDLAEVLVFNRALSVVERETVGGYLNQKYLLATNTSAPASLIATAFTASQVNLSWNSNSANISTAFQIERKTGSNGVYAVVGTVRDGTSFIDSGLSPSTQYYYRVAGVNLAGQSPYSNEATATTLGAGAPLPTTNMIVWLKADCAAALGDGTIADWRDSSGNANDATQGDPTQRPVLQASTINGLPVVHFDGLSRWFSFLPNFLGTMSQGEVFAVLRAAHALPSSQRSAWDFGDSQGGNQPGYPNTDGTITEDFANSSWETFTSPVSLEQFHVFNVDAQNAEWITRINGIYTFGMTQFTFNNSVTPTYGSTLGASFGIWQFYFEGDIAELLIFNRVLTGDERDSVGNYLNQRYNLVTNTPASVVYLNADSVSSSQISLTWTPVPLATEYLIERKTGAGGTYSQISTVHDAVNFIDTNLSPQTQYYYRLRAANFAGDSAYSSEVNATTQPAGGVVPFASLDLWLKADAQNWTNGTPMGRWPDLSSGRNDATQPAGYKQPLLVTNAVNGRPVVRFDGVNDVLGMPNFLAGNTQGELFVVLKAASDPPASTMGGMTLGPNGDTFPATDGTITEDFGTSSAQNLGAPLQPLNRYNIYNVEAGANDWLARLNGTTLLSTNNPGFAVTSAPGLGSSSSAYFAGDIAEVMVFDQTLTDSQRAAVATYLNQRYAIVPSPPPPPVLARVTNTTSSITLSWISGVTNSTGFVIERAADTNSPFIVIAYLGLGTESNYTDSVYMSGVNCLYRVRTVNLAGVSAPSNLISRSPDSNGDGLSDYLAAFFGTNPGSTNSDGDGLPDAWEIRYHLNPLSSTGQDSDSGNPSGDGISNLTHYQQGTDPTTGGPNGDNSVINLRLFTPLH